jgi:hypothetical protein
VPNAEESFPGLIPNVLTVHESTLKRMAMAIVRIDRIEGGGLE